MFRYANMIERRLPFSQIIVFPGRYYEIKAATPLSVIFFLPSDATFFTLFAYPFHL